MVFTEFPGLKLKGAMMCHAFFKFGCARKSENLRSLKMFSTMGLGPCNLILVLPVPNFHPGTGSSEWMESLDCGERRKMARAKNIDTCASMLTATEP